MRKYEAIDLMKLWSIGNNHTWNKMLNRCMSNLDINGLVKTRYQVQAGMDDLAKKKLNSEAMNIWYARLMRSLEITAKRIIKIKHPMPGDNPLIAKKRLDSLAQKRKRDLELKQFLEKSSY